MVTDDILYRRYLSGDEDGLSALMERHGDKLTPMAMHSAPVR